MVSQDLRNNLVQGKMMNKKGCQTFLVYQNNETRNEIIMDDVEIVYDVQDVFPKKLPSLSPDRQVGFTIDFEPGPAPVSKILYVIAPEELNSHGQKNVKRALET